VLSRRVGTRSRADFSGAKDVRQFVASMGDGEEERGPRPRERCFDCGRLSPQTLTAHTLISAQHGWRLLRNVDDDGCVRYEWRCRDCWKRRKERSDSD